MNTRARIAPFDPLKSPDEASREKPLAEWLTRPKAMAFVDVGTKLAFERLITSGGVRTKALPGSAHVRYFRPDLEKVVSDSIREGLPQRGA